MWRWAIRAAECLIICWAIHVAVQMGSAPGYPWVWRGSHSNGAGRSMDLLWHRRSSGLCLERSDPHHSQVEPPETLSEFLLCLQSPHLHAFLRSMMHRHHPWSIQRRMIPCTCPVAALVTPSHAAKPPDSHGPEQVLTWEFRRPRTESEHDLNTQHSQSQGAVKLCWSFD